MSTKTKKTQDEIADAWTKGTEEWQDAVRETNQEIHEEAKRMTKAGASKAEIVAMAGRKQREFSESYHKGE